MNNKKVKKLMDETVDNFNPIKDELLLLLSGEHGHAKLFEWDFINDVKVISDTDAYLFIQSKNLWLKLKTSDLSSTIGDWLEEKIKKHIDNCKQDDNNYSKLKKVLTKAQTLSHRLNIIKDATTKTSKLRDETFINQINNYPNILPISKGRLINLETLKIRLRQKTDYFDFELPFEYKSKFTNANKFFSQLMCNDQEIIDYLQIILGYCLTAETDMRSLFIFWGVGSNGKSSLCDIMKTILGKYYTALDKKAMILSELTPSHTSHLMPLLTARLAVLSETAENEKLDAKSIKTLTGCDTISCREIYQSQVTFIPKCKYIILTNHKPNFNIDDQAMVDRIKYIPFNARFTSEPKEGEFLKDSKFIEELSTTNINEVFSWLVIGANKYYRNRKHIAIPKKLKDATNDYINEIDTVAQFINEKCKIDSKSRVKCPDFYESYESYCCDSGVNYIKKLEFFKKIEKQYPKLKSNGVQYFTGITVNL